MQRHFIINIAFLVTLNLIIKPFWIFGIDRTIQNTVGSDSYGLYFAIFNFTFLFNSLLDLGMSNYNNWSVAKDPNYSGIQFKRMASLKIILGIAYLITTIIAGVILGYDNQSFKLLLILSGSQFLLSYILFMRSSISGLQLFWIDSIFSVLDRLFMIGICGFLLWSSYAPEGFNIEWFAWSQFSSYLAVILLAKILFWKNAQFTVGFEILKWSDLKHLLKKGLPYAVITLFMSMYYRLDAVMLQKLLEDGNYWSGIYAQGYRIFDMLNNFTFLFVAILFPLCTRMISKDENIWPVIQTAVKFLILPTIFLAALSFFYRYDIITMLYEDTSPQSAEVYLILILAYPLLVFSSLYGSALTANGNLKEMMWLTGSCLALNLLLNFSLIPSYQSIGAAGATLISQLYMAVGCFWLVMNRMGYRPTLQSNGRAITLSLAVTLNIWICSFQNLSLFITAAITIPFMIFAILVLKIIRPQEFLMLLKGKTM